MRRAFAVALLVIISCGSAEIAAAAPPPLMAATGTVVKANPNVLIIRPRQADGRFGSALVLKATGTTNATVLRTRGAAQTVFVQQGITLKELQPNQAIAVIYTSSGEEYVLLSAVARAEK
jgi:hypothetical protein